MNFKLELHKYNLAYLIKYTAAAFFYPYFGLFLAATGKTVKETGLILMTVPLVAVVFNPLWNFFAKNINYNKWFMVVFAFVESLLILLLMWLFNIYIVILIAGLLSVVSQPFYPMLEGYTTVYTMQAEKKYSTIRLFGSLGYALGVVISGIVIYLTGYDSILIITSSLLFLLGFVLITIRPLDLAKTEENQKGSLKELFKNKNFIIFFLFYIIIQATLFGGESYWGLYFDSRNINQKTFGWVSFISYSLEAIFLIVLAKIGSKFKIRTLMISVCLANSLRFLIFALELPFYVLVINSVVRAFVMSTLLYLIVRYLGLYIKKHNITLAIIIADSVKNIVQAIITQSGALVIENYSYNAFFYILSVIAILGLFFIKYREDSAEYAIISKE